MAIILFFLYFIFTMFVLYRQFSSPIWEIGTAIYLIASFMTGIPGFLTLLQWVIIGFILALLYLKSLRSHITRRAYHHAIHNIPKLSSTEEVALQAGDVWLEKDIFIGEPDWNKLNHIHTPLSEEEKRFLAEETEALCALLDEWSIHQNKDLPENVWAFIKEKGFLGLVISKEYGGKGFSALAHSEIVMKVASRSGAAAVTIMVPNSLGPGELLQYYGTEAQKAQYLPRLAAGQDIPCFALTEPNAGSDATAIQTQAIVTEKVIAGKTVLGLTINNLNKRWITLAPVATLIGLAVNLKDPQHLLKGQGQEGITCLLIARNTENLEIGNRHLPADQPFMNGTIRGNNLFVPIESIIGGIENAGKGWQMLVECLSIGRSISLPALGTASSGIAYLMSGAFARVRRQFNVEIAQLEGIEEKLAEIAGLHFLINSTRLLTVAAVNQHKKPSVASVITKYFNTELARITVNDALDIHGGRAVVAGPRNYLTSCYLSLPITITVEGANILSRNLLIFGQGSMACHPFILKEFYAVQQENEKAFGQLLWEHVAYSVRNFAKMICSAWTGGFLIATPSNPLRREYQKLARLSHAFAFLADFSLIYLGGALKRKERISARLADGLSYLYMAMGALSYFQQTQMQKDEECHAKWAVQYCFYHAQQALLNLGDNFPSRWLGKCLTFLAFPLGQTMRYPSDALDHQLAQMMSNNNHYRNTLKQHLYLSGNAQDPLDKMENAFQLVLKNQFLNDKVRSLKRFAFAEFKQQLYASEELNLTREEKEALIETERARWDAIQVDEFDFTTMKNKVLYSLIDGIPNPLDD